MKKQNRKLAVLMALAMVGLIGCGGGGGGSDSGTTDPIVTNTPTDSIAPAVTLTGEKSITMEQFTTSYTELGATANDETDGNVSVNISGDVNPEIPNVYTITYEAYDNSGNRGTVERYVTVTAPPEDTNKTKIDVLALYSAGTDALYEGDAETRLIQIMAVTNEIFNASRAGVEIVLVHAEQSSKISDTDSMQTGIYTAQADANITQMKDDVKADEVLIYRPYPEGDPACGRGYLNTDLLPEYAMAIIGTDCQIETTAHELGHNMGNNHSHLQEKEGDSAGFRPYSFGHLVEGDFGTVMSYAFYYNAERKLVFSNPDLVCNGQPCGIEAGEVGEADASRTIRETKTAISEFR